jgi:hypothetical protein
LLTIPYTLETWAASVFLLIVFFASTKVKDLK